MKNIAVIGLGFGDEGKGRTVDWLSSNHKNSIVVRFSGGNQAGHTVVRDNIRHVFSHFGSGTLCRLPTYWSQVCPVCPASFEKEHTILDNKNITPKIYINNKCPVITPYDVLYNRKNNLHGSCGVGFGSTIGREEKYFSLLFEDLFYPSIVKEKLKNIQNYYKIEPCSTNYFLKCCDYIKQKSIAIDRMPEYKNYIYEGSQGLLLDQHFGFFPHVTRSNTGLKNIKNNKNLKLFLVTRAYQTRHGNGFMTNENLDLKLNVKNKETNIFNIYQGEFRRSILDLDLLLYAINKDIDIKQNNNKSLVITCMDHLIKFSFTYKKNLYEYQSKQDFISQVKQILNIKTIYISDKEKGKLLKHI